MLQITILLIFPFLLLLQCLFCQDLAIRQVPFTPRVIKPLMLNICQETTAIIAAITGKPTNTLGMGNALKYFLIQTDM